MVASKKLLVIANWKLYVETEDAALSFAKALKKRLSVSRGKKLSRVEVGIAPSFPFIAPLAKVFAKTRVRVGAQTVSSSSAGAHTGEVTARVLKSAGAVFTLVGHSERRAAGETDEMVRTALRRADAAGLRIVLCVGEKERDDHGGHFSVIASQLSEALEGFPKSSAPRLVVAYEPVWAIGKSAEDAMKPHAVQETVIFIRKVLADLLGRPVALRVPVLYGGSAEPENVEALIRDGEVSGFLVGHASADADSFIEILEGTVRS